MGTVSDRTRCARATGANSKSFTDWDVKCWLAFGEPERPPYHQWCSPPMMESQSVCRVCRETMRYGTSGNGHPYTDRWCWDPLREKYKRAETALVSRQQVDRMLAQGLITEEQVEPLLEAKWGL